MGYVRFGKAYKDVLQTVNSLLSTMYCVNMLLTLFILQYSTVYTRQLHACVSRVLENFHEILASST